VAEEQEDDKDTGNNEGTEDSLDVEIKGLDLATTSPIRMWITMRLKATTRKEPTKTPKSTLWLQQLWFNAAIATKPSTLKTPCFVTFDPEQAKSLTVLKAKRQRHSQRLGSRNLQASYRKSCQPAPPPRTSEQAMGSETGIMSLPTLVCQMRLPPSLSA